MHKIKTSFLEIALRSRSTLCLRGHQIHWIPEAWLVARQAGCIKSPGEAIKNTSLGSPQRVWLPEPEGKPRNLHPNTFSWPPLLRLIGLGPPDNPFLPYSRRCLKITEHSRSHSLSEKGLEPQSPESFQASCHLGNYRLLTEERRNFVWKPVWPEWAVVDFASI